MKKFKENSHPIKTVHNGHSKPSTFQKMIWVVAATSVDN